MIFDQVDGQIGWKIEENSDCLRLHPNHREDPDHLGPDWIVPYFFNSEFRAEAVRTLIEQVKEAGIRIEGTIRSALEVWDAWHYEMAMCEFAYVMETGNFDELREKNGDKYVEEFKENWELDEYDGMVIDRLLIDEYGWQSM